MCRLGHPVHQPTMLVMNSVLCMIPMIRRRTIRCPSERDLALPGFYWELASSYFGFIWVGDTGIHIFNLPFPSPNDAWTPDEAMQNSRRRFAREHTGRSGEHCIAASRTQWWAMGYGALGAGGITALGGIAGGDNGIGVAVGAGAGANGSARRGRDGAGRCSICGSGCGKVVGRRSSPVTRGAAG